MRQLRIDGDAGDRVVSENQGWIEGGQVSINGDMYTTYTHATVEIELIIDTDIEALVG